MTHDDLTGIWEITGADGKKTLLEVDQSLLNDEKARMVFEETIRIGEARKLNDEEVSEVNEEVHGFHVVDSHTIPELQEEQAAFRQWFYEGDSATDPELQELREWLERTQTAVFFNAPEHAIDDGEFDLPPNEP